MSRFLNVKSKFIQAINVCNNITYGGYGTLKLWEDLFNYNSFSINK